MKRDFSRFSLREVKEAWKNLANRKVVTKVGVQEEKYPRYAYKSWKFSKTGIARKVKIMEVVFVC